MGALLSKKACVALCFLSSVPASTAWTQSFGGCTFSGTDGVSTLVSRTGECASQDGTLVLQNKKINGFDDGVFANMGKLQ
jgi:hypothetical protein